MTFFLALFAFGYWLPIFIISDFNFFDEEFGLFRDILFFAIPIIGYSLVFVIKSISGRIFNLLPEYQEFGQPKRNYDDKDKNLFNILTPDGFKRFNLLFRKLASPIADIIWIFLLTIFILAFTFDTW